MAYTAGSFVANEQPSASKFNLLWTNDAYFDAQIGSGTALTSYTPTYANLTVGNGTHRSAYLQLGKLVFVRIGFTFGSTSSMGTAPTATLPVTAKSSIYTASGSLLANGGATGGGTYSIPTYFATTTTVVFTIENSTATYTSLNNITASAPYASWTTGYTLDVQGWYEAA